MYTWLREWLWGERAYLTYWYAFLLSFPFSWRKTLIPSVAGGGFNEYLDFSLYVGDILLLFSFILIIKHEIEIKSIIDQIINKLKMFHVEHWVLLVFIGYVAFSFFWSLNYWLWVDGLISFLRVFITCSIFIFTLRNTNSGKKCSTWNIFRLTVWIFIIGIFLQVGIAVVQFMGNSSLGLTFIGESQFTVSDSGIAKIDFDNGKQIRSYGTFLHPNIFGGYLVIAILIIFIYIRYIYIKKMFHVEQIWLLIALGVGFLGLILSFSKSAQVSILVGMIVYLFHVEQMKWKKMFHVEHWLVYISAISLCVAILVLGFDQIQKSISERIFLLLFHVEHFYAWFLGNGWGQSVYNLVHLGSLEPWQLQPAHNIYLNILLEIGIVGTCLISILLWKLFQNVPRGTNRVFLLPLLAIGIIGLFDHYPLDIYAGQILLSLSLGLAISAKSINIDK